MAKDSFFSDFFSDDDFSEDDFEDFEIVLEECGSVFEKNSSIALFSSLFDNKDKTPSAFLSANNNYFQEELDDNLPDDYVINGFGSLDDDE